jgi:hypothetical protein
MTNQTTKSKFAEILAQAQAKAEAQATGKKVETKPQAKAKPVQVYVQPPVQVPQPKPTPTTNVRVVTKDNLIQRYRSMSVPELSTTTIDDVVGEAKPPKVMTIRIVHYSDKCVAVMGDTKPHKDSLKAIGGKFNPWLKGGEGWVFPKWKEAEIRAVFSL